ncbi:MAG: hypothetical protein AAFY56_12090 [Pseudomonadota bacterium]
MADAEQRQSLHPTLWPVDEDAREKIESVVRVGVEGADPSVRELWLLAEASGRTVGMTHTMMVPVPPIYEALSGPPGLILDDCFTTDDAPSGTAQTLLAATEAALRDAGAKLLLASCLAGGQWRSIFERHGYEPVTLYMGKVGFEIADLPTSVRPAGADDVPGIVAASAEHRKILSQLNAQFWNIHPDANARFDRWMRRSLTLADREMFVSDAPDEVQGYIIAQPVSSLLIPAAHDINAIGVIDDYYDKDFANPSAAVSAESTAAELLSTAEGAFARRNVEAALVVCPAAWRSKISVLERRGYRTAKLWMLKS